VGWPKKRRPTSAQARPKTRRPRPNTRRDPAHAAHAGLPPQQRRWQGGPARQRDRQGRRRGRRRSSSPGASPAKARVSTCSPHP